MNFTSETAGYLNAHTMSNIVITEMLNSTHQNEDGDDDDAMMSEYLVEEPYDFIFEPGHYQMPTNSSVDQQSHHHHQQQHQQQHRRFVEERDGILIYEHSSSTDRFEHFQNQQQHHLNALIRSISLSKRPGTGFGFDLTRNNEDFVYVSNIMPDSPAEFCLQLGDVFIEVDEMNPIESFKDIMSLSDYLNRRDNVNILAIHHSKYMKLKSENEEINSYCCSNCKDIVIVAWRENQHDDNHKPR